ncbi:MAG: molecular chaperone TorD family protein [Arcobacteraceae bacterium]|jgi:TorA maturation chaperone TorD|nr:molecular chaperone TorD family protein [Arcobacteraceae bacterium]
MKNDIEINKARAVYYNIFANFFILNGDMKSYFELLRMLNLLVQAPLDDGCAEAMKNILSKLDKDSNVTLMQEFDNIFHSPLSKNIRTTASFYDEQVESGKKRVQMVEFVAKTPIRRDEQKYHEYEDSVGFIFAFMSELIELINSGKVEYINTVHCVFEQVLNEFVDEFAKNVYEHKKSDIYRNLMVVLHSFIEFERLYLQVSKPKPKEVLNQKDNLSDEERARRERNKALKALGPKQSCSDGSCAS